MGEAAAEAQAGAALVGAAAGEKRSVCVGGKGAARDGCRVGMKGNAGERRERGAQRRKRERIRERETEEEWEEEEEEEDNPT